ncbi:MAG: hypothetical protein L6Q40_13615 [Azonexus sp.]|nr:hypothetical protein [Azonexus sp.]
MIEFLSKWDRQNNSALPTAVLALNQQSLRKSIRLNFRNILVIATQFLSCHNVVATQKPETPSDREAFHFSALRRNMKLQKSNQG